MGGAGASCGVRDPGRGDPVLAGLEHFLQWVGRPWNNPGQRVKAAVPASQAFRPYVARDLP
jgi:hypothetical protein